MCRQKSRSLFSKRSLPNLGIQLMCWLFSCLDEFKIICRIRGNWRVVAGVRTVTF